MAAGFLSAVACGESEKKDDCDRGEEGCPCKRDDTCDVPLECRSDVCVNLGGSGASGGRGGGGNAGSAGGGTCPPGELRCGTACVDPATDANHCGACASPCGVGSECADGVCACQGGLESCGGACVATSSDPSHCGTCGNLCDATQVCSQAECASGCSGELVDCNRSCVDTDADVLNCGQCGVACGAGQACSSGSCVCLNGLEKCGDVCVNVDSDTSNCGTCANVCEADQTCDSGQCQGGGASGGAPGTGGGAGQTGEGGAGATPATGGAGGTAGNAGSGGSGGSGGSSDPTGSPLVLILLDRSSSMFEPLGAPPWDMAYSALMDEADGAVALFEDRVRFGFATFRGGQDFTAETEDACAEVTSVSFADENRDAIDVQYQTLTAAGTNMLKWETPTGHAIHRAMRIFEDDGAADGRKFILLLTDGNPNTCRIHDPQCGQDVSIKGVQDARAAGITTLVLGFGDIVTLNSGCMPEVMRCGSDHLQDLANAGVGFAVTAQPEPYTLQACVSSEGGLTATYGSGAAGMADFYEGETTEELQADLVSMLTRIVDGSVP